MKNTKNKCYPFLAESLNSLGFAEAEYNFLKYSAPLPLAFLLFPFSPNRRGGGIWQLLEYMFRICLLEQFSWSLDRNAFSLKDWNYELSERIWINKRWMLGLCLLLLCFVFLIRINQSSQNDWLVQEQEWAQALWECLQFPPVVLPFWQNLTPSVCRFGFLICQASVAISRCGEDAHSEDSCMFSCMEAGRWQIFHHSCACAFCLLRTSFISCPALSSGWVSLCFISSLPMEVNKALFSTRGSCWCRHSKSLLCHAMAALLSSETSNSFINCLFLTPDPLLTSQGFTKAFNVLAFPDSWLDGKGGRQSLAVANCSKWTFQFPCKYLHCLPQRKLQKIFFFPSPPFFLLQWRAGKRRRKYKILIFFLRFTGSAKIGGSVFTFLSPFGIQKSSSQISKPRQNSRTVNRCK